MPDVAATILEKIDAATVFVGDVTPVGATPPVKGNEGAKSGRPLMNPNVAIETMFCSRGTNRGQDFSFIHSLTKSLRSFRGLSGSAVQN